MLELIERNGIENFGKRLVTNFFATNCVKTGASDSLLTANSLLKTIKKF